LVHDIYSSFLAPILPLLIEKFGLSYTLASVLSIVQRAPNILNPLVGFIADKYPVRWFVISTPLITSISMSLLGIAPNFVLLCILLFVAGLSAVFFHAPSPVLVKEISGNSVGKGMSFYMIGGEIARTLGPLIILGAISIWGLEGSFKLLPFSLLASVIIYIKLKNVDTHKHAKGNADAHVWKTFKNLLPLFLIMGGVIFFRQFMKSGLTTFLPTYFGDFKNQEYWIGVMSLVVYEGAGILGTFFGGTLSDKFGRKKILITSAILSPLLMLIFLHTSGIFVFIVLFLVGISQFASSPVLLAYIQEIDSDHPSFVNSIYMFLSFGFGSITLLFFGMMSDWADINVSMNISAYVAFGAIPFIFLLPSKKKED
jgi:FSR family fosmidomycin resistance protein-like MFS transporter